MGNKSVMINSAFANKKASNMSTKNVTFENAQNIKKEPSELPSGTVSEND